MVVGITLLALGLFILGFVPYLIYTTNGQSVAAQKVLSSELTTQKTTKTLTTKHVPSTVPTASWPKTVPLGTPLAKLSIPTAGVLNDIVVEGADELRLQEGPGHYPNTALPGQSGNVAIAGHRTTWLRPFYDLNAVKPGDQITLSLGGTTWVYSVAWIRIVQPSDTSVLAPTANWSLTLTTCTPLYSAAQRLIVRATLDKSATLAANTTTSTRRISITRLATHKTVIQHVSNWLAIVWIVADALALAAALIVKKRTSLWFLVLIACIIFSYEAYGPLAQLVPPAW
jgi:sortase A